MKLIIDLGNTLTKFYFFNKKSCLNSIVHEGIPDNPYIENLLYSHGPFESAIISSVVNQTGLFTNTIQQHCPLLIVDHTTPLPVSIHYLTPASLGIDRIAAAVAGHSRFPKNNVLIIDAGSCITYDFITDKGEYLGGAIAPGLNMQLKALHHFTANLPLIPLSPNTPLTGRSTEEAILSGTVNHTIAAMQHTIRYYSNKYKDLKIILSGGDRIFFDKQLKISIFAVPNIVATGLNEILDFNEKI
jgi:type III pantothenate kinase